MTMIGIRGKYIGWGIAAAALLSSLLLGGCTGQEASRRLVQDLPGVGAVEIVHARFPCFSPDFHLYGYRFKVASPKKMTEWSFGDICWNFSMRRWTWVMLARV
jgi:hypothetical protein